MQISVGDLAGVSTSTVCRVLHLVSGVIAMCARDDVMLPASREERAATMLDFHALAGFPGVLGAIDCTHIPIQSPGGVNSELYRNRKGYFSLNVQGVVNSHLLFENVVARWQGSSHDANIFANSRLCARLESGEIGNAYLLGDSGYPCKPYLLTPLGVALTEAESLNNFRQTRK